MNNERLPWLILILCLLTLLGAIIWVSSTVLGFEDEDLRLHKTRATEENVRQVLFRIDGRANQIIEKEFKAFDESNEVPQRKTSLCVGYILIAEQEQVYFKYAIVNATETFENLYKSAQPVISIRDNEVPWTWPEGQVKEQEKVDKAFYAKETCRRAP